MTTTSDPRQVSVSRVIAAEPDAIFAVLADPAMHRVIDGSGTVRSPSATPSGCRSGRSSRWTCGWASRT